jgi:hypothetical protein
MHGCCTENAAENANSLENMDEGNLEEELLVYRKTTKEKI